MRERRNGDINVIEKRLAIWGMALMVGVCTTALVELRADFKVVSTELAYGKEYDTRQDEAIKEVEDFQYDIHVDVVDHEGRLCVVERKLDISIPKKQKGEEINL